jgi:hypothetical protein
LAAFLSLSGTAPSDGVLNTLLSMGGSERLAHQILSLFAVLIPHCAPDFRAFLAARLERDLEGYWTDDQALFLMILQQFMQLGEGTRLAEFARGRAPEAVAAIEASPKENESARALAAEEAAWRARTAPLAGRRSGRPDAAATRLHTLAAQIAILACTQRHNFSRFLNGLLRDGENRCASAASARSCAAPGRSFRLGCFAAPMCANLAVLPVPASLQAAPADFAPRLFGRTFPSIRTAYESPAAIFRFSISLPGSDDLPSFEILENVTLLRLDVRVSCVLARAGDFFSLLVHARFDGGISLLPDYCPGLELAVLSGQFGRFSLHRGHFLLSFAKDAILGRYKYNHAGCPHAIELFTATAGSFILIFNRPSRVLTAPSNRRLADQTQRWASGGLTTLDYLLAVNFAGQRSFNDFSAYPVVPRVLTRFVPPELRDLSLPIEVVADPDPGHVQLHARFRAAGAHHKDGVSNPLSVATLLVRLVPFCHRYWETHGGWDHGGRDFSSVPAQLGVNTQTAHELPVEMFALPEAFENVNQLELNGVPFEVSLPPQTSDPHRFVEWHRALLEGAREGIAGWIDHLFGIARDGKNAEARLNVFPATMYVDDRRAGAPDEVAIECGVIPARVFKDPHPSAAPIVALEPPAIVLRWDLRRPPSRNGLFSVAVCEGGEVQVFRKRALQGRVWLDGARFAVLWEEQMLCYTVCRDCVAVWCFATEHIIRKIPEWEVIDLILNPERAAIFIAARSRVKQYSVNGELVREVEIGAPIRALAVAVVAPWAGGVWLAVAVRGGRVFFVGTEKTGAEKGQRELAILGDPEWARPSVHALEFSEDGRQLFAYIDG